MILSTLAFVLAPAAGSGAGGLCLQPETSLCARYVEARTASVFAGACHYGGEYTTDGRKAVIAWSFDSGIFEGVDLAGLSCVAYVQGETNLAETDASRRWRLYVSEEVAAPAREALARLLERLHAGSLGVLEEVRSAPVSVRIGEESYEVGVREVVELAGRTLPDRACCKMPFQVWYRPLAPIEKPLVGCSDIFRFEGEKSERFLRSEENNAFLGKLSAAE